MRKNLSFFIVCLSVVAVASAAQVTDFYVIPAASHAPGANGTSWRTDMSIQNIQSVPVVIDIAVVESGEGLLDNVFSVTTVTVPAGGNMTLSDVLNNHRGRAQTTGALLVGGDHAFALTSRTYNATANGTLGQTVSASGDVASDDSSTLYIPGLVQNGAFRTNVGLLMSATSAPLTVMLTINGANGSALGSRTFTVPAGATTHVQFPVTSTAPAPFDAGGAVVTVTGGIGTVIAYASVVDNFTGDASFISGGSAGPGGTSSLRQLLTR
ncbi:MAG: hypothetical protein ABI837_12510 [Acidobacteriota bacterium]